MEEVGEYGSCMGYQCHHKAMWKEKEALSWPFACGCKAFLPVILEIPMRHDMICKGKGQQEGREHMNSKGMITSLIGPIY